MSNVMSKGKQAHPNGISSVSMPGEDFNNIRTRCETEWGWVAVAVHGADLKPVQWVQLDKEGAHAGSGYCGSQ